MLPRAAGRPPGWGGLVKRGAARLFPRAVMVRGPWAAGRVALTFDDGPHPQQTPRLLEVLARTQTQATFFLQGDHAARFPDWVREIHRAGHQVANHSYSHVRARQRAAHVFVDEVERTHALLEDLVGDRLARDYRPPYGNLTPRTFAALALRGYRSVFWTVDSGDSAISEADALVDHVASIGVGAGDVVLCHEDYAHTIAALPRILAAWQARGLAVHRLDRLDRLVAA